MSKTQTQGGAGAVAGVPGFRAGGGTGRRGGSCGGRLSMMASHSPKSALLGRSRIRRTGTALMTILF